MMNENKKFDLEERLIDFAVMIIEISENLRQKAEIAVKRMISIS